MRNIRLIVFVSAATLFTSVSHAGESAMAARLLSVAKATLQVDESHTTIRLTRVAGAIEALSPGQIASLSITPLTKGTPRGVTPLRVDVTTTGGASFSAQATIDVRHFDSALVALVDLPLHTALKNETIVQAWVDVTDRHDATLESVSAATGLWTQHAIAKGRVLSVRDFAPIPAIRARDEVVISYENAGLTITASGTAIDEGVVGETVRVRNLTSGKVIHTEVIAPGRVRVRARGGVS